MSEKKNEIAKKTDLMNLSIQDIPSLLETVNEQIETLKGGKTESNPAKNAVLDGFGKISDITDIQLLVKAASSVMGKAKYYKEAAEIVAKDINVPEFSINGVTEKQWLKAVQKRIIQVMNAEKLKKLEQVRKTLEENLSAEAKLANDLKKIAEIISEK